MPVYIQSGKAYLLHLLVAMLSINVSWVMEFLTCWYYIILILSKTTNGFQGNCICCHIYAMISKTSKRYTAKVSKYEKKYWYNASPRRGLALSMQIVNFLIEFLCALFSGFYRKGPALVNVYFQFSQQSHTN